MIVTFGTQKGGAGKTTLAIAFANYLSSITDRKINAFDFDYQKSFFNKWIEDESSDLPKLYDVKIVGEDGDESIGDLESIINLKESEDINIFDLAGTLDDKYSDLLIYSDFIVTPFEYSELSTKSTFEFIYVLGDINSEASSVFIRSKYDKGYKYLNQVGTDAEIEKYGNLLKSPVFKRNCLQNIGTRHLSYEQKYAVRNPFNELINHINETLQITL